jgi:hypothetical protein
MNIEGHLEEDRDRIEFLAKRYANNRDDMEDVRQEIILKMIERHGAFDHDHKSGASLLSYVQYVLKREVIFPTLDDYQHITDNTVVIPPADVDEEGIDSLEDYEEMGRVAPINWYGEGYGDQISTLNPDDQELAENLKAKLTKEELAILDVSVHQKVLADGRSVPISERAASEFLTELGYKMSRSTYRRRLTEIKEKIKPLLPGYMIFPGDE